MGGQYSHESFRVSNQPGVLYIVATPIGNLEDVTQRALKVLAAVDLVAAEDTRHSGRLLSHFGIQASLMSLHEHNEEQQVERVLDLLAQGGSVAVVSDAGTPLINDPGFRLVREARRRELPVVPVPGASSLIAALSVAGLPTDRFCFEGFLAAKPSARRHQLQGLAQEPRTLVFFESPHRILGALEDLRAAFGPDREAAVARELTKTFETVRAGSLDELLDWMRADDNQQRGEFVLVVAGRPESAAAPSETEARRVLRVLLSELPLKQAAKLAAQITGAPKNQLYAWGLAAPED